MARSATPIRSGPRDSSSPRRSPSAAAPQRCSATSSASASSASRATPRHDAYLNLAQRRSDTHRREQLVLEAQRGDERLLRDLDAADLLHAPLARLLLLEQFALAGHVAAVALGDDVLAAGLDRLAGDDAPVDRGLDRDVEELARDELAQLQRHATPV